MKIAHNNNKDKYCTQKPKTKLIMMHNKQKLDNMIRQKKINTVKFCYYPFYDKINGNIMKLKTMSPNNVKHILSGINIDQHIKGSYTEYGLRDTFMRSTNIITNNTKETQNMFFRRETYTTYLNDCPGIFVVELYTHCDEYNFPLIIDYPHYLRCNVDTHIVTIDNDNMFRLCFTKVEDSKNISSKNTTYFNICRDVIIDETVNINCELESFFKDVLSLKKNHNKNFCGI